MREDPLRQVFYCNSSPDGSERTSICDTRVYELGIEEAIGITRPLARLKIPRPRGRDEYSDSAGSESESARCGIGPDIGDPDMMRNRYLASSVFCKTRGIPVRGEGSCIGRHAGISSSEGPLVNVSINERNLLGRGQKLRLSFLLSSIRQQIDLGFTEPYFLGRELSAGVDVFIRDADLTDQDNFDE
ncbi:MAG: BamA/TamA family outer membrane protein, partial [Bacteroidetes bacterium]|nr:BamA/TamA family outer membrane protein [Bacteroidota bacterium]